MGNRAVITTEDKEIGVYVHYNGGRDSIEGFLKYCEIMQFRSPETDDYGWARLCQVLGNFFGANGLCVGVNDIKKLDSEGDNGTYITKDWKIIGRENFDGQEHKEYPLEEMLEHINKKQPNEVQDRFLENKAILDAKS